MKADGRLMTVVVRLVWKYRTRGRARAKRLISHTQQVSEDIGSSGESKSDKIPFDMGRAGAAN